MNCPKCGAAMRPYEVYLQQGGKYIPCHNAWACDKCEVYQMDKKEYAAGEFAKTIDNYNNVVHGK